MEEKSKKQKEKELLHPKETLLQYQGKLLSLYTETFTWDDKSKTTLEIVKHPGAVGILAIDDQENILLIRQWRTPIQRILIEIPAGTLEKNELPQECAYRELQEETGFKPLTLIPLGGLYSTPGFSNEYIHLFLAKDLIPSPLQAEDTEGIDLFKISLPDALSKIQSGEISDSKTMAAICLYQQRTLCS